MGALKDKLVSFALKAVGLGKLWEAFDGKKAYIGGISSILLGAGALAARIATAGSPAELLEMAKTLPGDPAVAMLLGGLSVVGLRHSNAKLEAKSEEPK